MFNGLFSLISLSWGNGSLSVSSPEGTPSYPPAGSYNSTLFGETYPIAQGGSFVGVDILEFPNQKGDVNVLNDGSGGTYIDWSSITNIVYKDQNDPAFYNDGTAGANQIQIVELANYYESSTWSSLDYLHDGSGGYSTSAVNFAYKAQGTSYGVAYGTTINAPSIEVPNASGNYFSWGYANDTEYFADGAGGYYAGPYGSYTYYTGVITTGPNYQTEVPSTSGNYFDTAVYPEYVWDGAGGYTTQNGGSYYPYGTFITNDGTYDYYWDGNGGYYT